MEILDILILGSGPAALCLASELAKQNLNIKGISTKSVSYTHLTLPTNREV